jgi:hypothetical protein
MKRFNKPKLPIGEWKIGDDEDFISFALKQKPHWFHRLMARFFFGLRWIDFETPKDVKPSKGIRRGITKWVEPQKGRHRR